MSNLPTKAKVVIIGGGIHGLSTAWHLAAKLKAKGKGDGSKILVIDKDSIEISNLARQILFSTKDIKKNKSSIAINKLKKINPDIKLKSFSKNISSKS